MTASQYRAIQKYKAEALEAERILSVDKYRNKTGSSNTISIPTVVRRVVELVPSVDIEDLPDALQETVARVENVQHSANRAIGVQLFNRRDGINASINNGISDIDLFNNVNGAINDIDHSVIDARVSHFSILGVKRGQEGFRYVSAVLDEETRMKLQFQANIIRNGAGLEPRGSIAPFHFSVFSTRDQLEAENVLEECRCVPAELSLALSGPLIKTIVQRTGSADVR